MPRILIDNLSIQEIANYWSREIQRPKTPEELADFLESAWWLGKLKGLPPFTTRLALLRAMFSSARASVSSGIVFFTPEEASGVEQPDGSLLIALDLDRPGVPVPSRDPDTWTEESCVGAFEKLSQTPSRKHYHDRTIGFLSMKLSRDQFYSLLTEAGLEVPKFWGPLVATAKEEYASARVAKTLHQTPGSATRTRGPKPTKLEQVKQQMRRDLQGELTRERLETMLEKELAEKYKASRDTARKARGAVLSEFVENSNRDK
jgi:hypothetical protein